MSQPVDWTDQALEDLRAIGDIAVMKELLSLAKQELSEPSFQDSLRKHLEGYEEGNDSVMWRRGVRYADLDEYLAWNASNGDGTFRRSAFSFVLVYRLAKAREYMTAKLSPDTLVVTAVLSNDEYTEQIIERFGRKD